MIRFILGLLLTLGAVGTFDTDPNASLVYASFLASFGILLMYFGVRNIRE